MITALFSFIGGFMLTWPALVLFIIFGILAEHNQARGWAIFMALAVAAISYFYFNIPLFTIALGAVIYVIIGLVWSFWRYKRHADKVVEENKNQSDVYKHRALEALHPRAMLGTITAWIIIWPFSMIENVVGDVITAIQLLVQKVFRGIYHRIYDSAVSSLTGK